MGFKFDKEQANQEFSIKPEGDYTCIIDKIETKKANSGNTALNFWLKIATGQAYAGAYLFYAIWKKKEPNDNDLAVDGYNFGQLMSLGGAAGLTDGKEYGSLQEYLNDLSGKTIVAVLKHREYDGKQYEEVKSVKAPECQPKAGFTTAGTGNSPLAQSEMDSIFGLNNNNDNNLPF